MYLKIQNIYHKRKQYFKIDMIYCYIFLLKHLSIAFYVINIYIITHIIYIVVFDIKIN